MNDENKLAPQSSIIKEDPVKQRMEKLFKDQQQQMQAMVFKRHKFGCNVFDCKEDPCFIWEPDKIVARSIVCGICKGTIEGALGCLSLSCRNIASEWKKGIVKSISKKIHHTGEDQQDELDRLKADTFKYRDRPENKPSKRKGFVQWILDRVWRE